MGKLLVGVLDLSASCVKRLRSRRALKPPQCLLSLLHRTLLLRVTLILVPPRLPFILVLLILLVLWRWLSLALRCL